MPDDSSLRKYLLDLLNGGNAHTTFDDAVNGFPIELAGIRPDGSPHSAWELLEHLRIAQEDILRFSQSEKHVSPPWPKGYWPNSPAPARDTQWQESVDAIRRAGSTDKEKVRQAMQATRGYKGVLGSIESSYGFADGKRIGFDPQGMVVRMYEGDRQGRVLHTGTR